MIQNRTDSYSEQPVQVGILVNQALHESMGVAECLKVKTKLARTVQLSEYRSEVLCTATDSRES